MDTISLGFDIATAISVVGAAITFMRKLKEERKTAIGEERETLRVEKLMTVQNTISSLTKDLLINFHPNSKASSEEKSKTLYLTHTSIQNLYTNNMSIIPRNDLVSFEKLYSYDMENFNGARYLLVLIELDKSLSSRIRKIMNNETQEEENLAIDTYVQYHYNNQYETIKKQIQEFEEN